MWPARCHETVPILCSAQVLYGGATREQGANLPSKGYFVQPTIIAIDHSAAVVQHEAFVPCLYVMKVKTYEEAVSKNNSVSQGLSSSLFTRDMRSVFRWMGPQGSDCGLVNVNAGTSGEERVVSLCTVTAHSSTLTSTIAPHTPACNRVEWNAFCCLAVTLTAITQALRSAALSEERRTLAAAGRAEATAGSSTHPVILSCPAVLLLCQSLVCLGTCADRPAPSITATTCHWLKESHLTFDVCGASLLLEFPSKPAGTQMQLMMTRGSGRNISAAALKKLNDHCFEAQICLVHFRPLRYRVYKAIYRNRFEFLHPHP